MSKYEPLADYLRSHGGEACSLTIRAMTPAPLPDSTELIREDRARR